MYKPQKGNSTRIEIRSPDSACNPYLTYAVLLAAGLKGIEEGYELPDGAEDDVWALTDAERRAMGIAPLPGSLSDAIKVMENSELMAETLGEGVFDFFMRNKRSGVGGLPPPGHAVRARALPARLVVRCARSSFSTSRSRASDASPIGFRSTASSCESRTRTPVTRCLDAVGARCADRDGRADERLRRRRCAVARRDQGVAR